MSSAQQIRADVFTAAEEITRRFSLVTGNVDRREGAGPMQDGELTGVAAISLDAITRAPRNQRWRDHLARYVAGAERALQLEAAGPRFVAAAYGGLVQLGVSSCAQAKT